MFTSLVAASLLNTLGTSGGFGMIGTNRDLPSGTCSLFEIAWLLLIVGDVTIGICGIEELLLTIALLDATFVVLFTVEIRSFTSNVTLELATYTN